MKNNMKRSLRHKIRWAIIFLMPLLLSPITVIIQQIQENTCRVGVIASLEDSKEIEHSGKDSIEMICSMLNEKERIDAEPANRETYHTDIIVGTYDYIIDCSKGICEEAVVSTKTEKETKAFFQQMFGGDSSTAAQSDRENELHPTAMQQAVSFLMSLFMIMSVLQGGMYLRDKNQRLVVRYCYAPKNKMTYLAGNLCYIFLITLIQVAASFLLLCLVNGTWLSLGVSIQVIAMITSAASVFAVMLCALCKNDTQAGISASAIAAFFTVISGTFVTIDSMPHILQVISKFSPIRWCMELIKL